MKLVMFPKIQTEINKIEAFNLKNSSKQIAYGPNVKKIVQAPGKPYDEMEVVDCSEHGYGILGSSLRERGIKLSQFSQFNTNNVLLQRDGRLADIIHNLRTIDLDIVT